MPKYYVSEIRRALRQLMTEDEKYILIGEDIKDPFGGCFKVTQGLSTLFPNRVINTPISEAAITGLCTGLALKGFRPILEIMFYDFMTLAMDQILNQMMKIKELWNIDLNITIRTVIGKKDYGVTHCQNLDYLFKNVITVVHPTIMHNVYEELIKAAKENKPVLFVEEANLYKQKLIIP